MNTREMAEKFMGSIKGLEFVGAFDNYADDIDNLEALLTEALDEAKQVGQTEAHILSATRCEAHLEKAVAAEREACAKVVESYASTVCCGTSLMAAQIRSRSGEKI